MVTRQRHGTYKPRRFPVSVQRVSSRWAGGLQYGRTFSHTVQSVRVLTKKVNLLKAGWTVFDELGLPSSFGPGKSRLGFKTTPKLSYLEFFF